MNITMKHLSLTLTFLAALLLPSIVLQAAPTAASETLNRYVIDKKPAEHFDGSQLEGRKIVSYRITTDVSHGRIVRTHTISTEPPAEDYVYVIDGNQVPKSFFVQLDPNGIKSITIIKNGSRDDIDVTQYDGWENGVVLVETKKDGSRIFKSRTRKK